MPEDGLQQLSSATLDRIRAASTEEELEKVRVEVLGRKGSLAQFSRQMATLQPDDRARVGKSLNSVKQTLEQALEERKSAFAEIALRDQLESEWVDLTLPAPGPCPGSLHPLTQVQAELEELFVSLGFTVLSGPEVETEYNNFDALNIPPDHPARDMQDTFWLEGG